MECKTSVTCTCRLTLESISSCLGQNNLRIINLFLRRSREHQTDFHITFKHYVSLDIKRDLGLFGEFPHIAILTITSSIVINVPTRRLLAVETKDSFVLCLAKFKYQMICFQTVSIAIENSILVLAVNCCIYKHYANYVSELCSFGDIFLSKLKNMRF